MRNLSLKPLLPWLCLTVLAPFLVAQEAEQEDEIYQLSPFEVVAQEGGGYASSESITGSRIRSSIAELPFAVNVVTNEFIEDFAADTLDEQFGYVSSFAPDGDVEGWYQLRGFKQQNQLRNGFTRLGLIDRVTVARAEVIKGPAAASYGKINPGGIINIVTKKPQPKPGYEFSLEAGTDSYFRSNASATGPVAGNEKLLYRVDGSWLTRDDFAFTGREQTTLSGVLRWLASEQTQVTLEAEYLERDQSRGRGLLPIRDDGEYTRLATELYDFSFLGPDEYNNRDIKTLDLTIDHKFDSSFSVRAGFSVFDRYYDQWTGYPSRVEIDSAAGETVLEDGWVPFVEPVSYEIFQDGVVGQVDFLKTFQLGESKHQLLFTVDYNRQNDDRQRARLNRSVTSDQQLILEERFGIDLTHKDLRRSGFFNIEGRGYSVADPDYSWLDLSRRPLVRETDTFGIVGDNEDPIGIGLKDRDEVAEIEVKGFFVSERVELLNRKLIVNIGGRYDEVSSYLATRSFNLGNAKQSISTSDYTVDNWTYQFGANYRLQEGLLAYFNTSTSFLPVREFNTVDPVTGDLLPEPQVFDNETGEGFEVGLKGASLGGKFNFTLNYFDIERQDVVISELGTDAMGEDFTFKSQNGLESASGMEFDFNYEATEALNLVGGIGILDSTIEKTDNAAIDGLPVAQIPDYNASLALKYTVRHGSMKGFFYTFGVRTYGESRMTDSGGREHIYQDAYELFEGSVGYRWKGDKISHSVQVTGKNLTDEEYTRGNGTRGEIQRFIFRYQAKM